MTALTVRQVLAEKRFFRLWMGQLVSIFGDFVALFAVQVAVVFRLHGTARETTGVMVAFLAPPVLIGPLAGVFVDRWNPRRTMIASDLLRGLLVLFLAFTTNLPQIYAVCFALSCVSSFFLPAQSVTLPLLVGHEGLMAANSLMQQTIQLVRIFSPVVANALAGSIGEAACYYADSVTFFFSAAMIASLAYDRPVDPAARGFGTVLSELRQGVRFVLTHPAYSFVILSMTAGLFAITCFSSLVPVFVRDVLHAGAYLFGAIGSLIGLGSIAGAVAMMKLRRGLAPHMVSVGMSGIGLSILLLAAVRNRPVTLSCSFAIGVSAAIIMMASAALLQGETPPEMRGRVTSSAMAMIAMAQTVALLCAGGWAERLGTINLFYASAAMLFSVALGGTWRLTCARSSNRFMIP
jgi:DHA3 family macrolide efflux protein-like MFS transporter